MRLGSTAEHGTSDIILIIACSRRRRYHEDSPVGELVVALEQGGQAANTCEPLLPFI